MIAEAIQSAVGPGNVNIEMWWRGQGIECIFEMWWQGQSITWHLRMAARRPRGFMKTRCQSKINLGLLGFGFVGPAFEG